MQFPNIKNNGESLDVCAPGSNGTLTKGVFEATSILQQRAQEIRSQGKPNWQGYLQ